MDNKNLQCVIMAGGSGTRFWPRSKTAKPKQYLNIFGDESLLQSTIKRFSNFIETQNIFIVSNKSQSAVLESQTEALSKENLIYEPVGKNTLPCIGLAAMFAELRNKDGIMVVSPSDHLIKNHKLFKDTILTAAILAEERNGIVTIGIVPTYPSTGYGYVEISEAIDNSSLINQFVVSRFVEKPDEEKAREFLSVDYQGKKKFYWNSGLFVFKVSVFLETIKKCTPDLYSELKKIQANIDKPGFKNTLDTIYSKLDSVSIDYGIMEHATNVFLVEGNFDWNDLGSWESVYLASQKDEHGNSGKGGNILIDSRNSYVYSDNCMIALIGLDNVIAVQEGNTILVCKRESAENVKGIVDLLKKGDKKEYL